MTYSSKVTTKGQVTIPVHLRKKLSIKPGQRLTFSLNKNGNAEIIRPVNIEELQRQNQILLRKRGFTTQKLRRMAEEYKSGDGITAHVLEKYGKK
jgi:AbrB family looped-hinge helix DNA binding protein